MILYILDNSSTSIYEEFRNISQRSQNGELLFRWRF